MVVPEAYPDDVVLVRLVSPKHFSCDSIELTLHSEDAISKLISLGGHQDPRSIVVTFLNLFFTIFHLFAFNSKHQLKPIERAQIL